MQSGAKQHPKGTVTVKELYGQGSTVQGWSVGIKTAADSSSGSNWYCYEVFQDKVVKDGQRHTSMPELSLHRARYVLTPWPAETT